MEKRSEQTLLDRLAIHVAGYVVLLVLVLALIPLDSSFGGDDGAYGGQVYALQQGSWTLDRPLAVVPEANEGWLNTAITPDGPTPYTANPAYPVLLRAAADLVPARLSAALGPAAEGAGPNSLGLQIVPLLGAVFSAIVAWLLALRWVPTSDTPGVGPAPLAFWIVALGPVLVNSTTLWAHTLSTALAGASLLCLLMLHDRSGDGGSGLSGGSGRMVWPLLGLVVAAALAALLRTESVFWVGALFVTALLALRTRAAIVGASTTTVVAAGVWLTSRSWGQSLRAERLEIETSVDALSPSTGWLESRLPAAWQLFATSTAGGIGPLLSLLALSTAIFAALKLRASDENTDEPVIRAALVVSALLYGAQLILAPGDVISGTFAAWPVVAVLLIGGMPGLRTDAGSERLAGLTPLLLPVGVLAIGVVLTQYANSGGHQWGGRYLSMGFAPLGVAAAVAGGALFTRHRMALGALLVVPALLGVVVSHQLHTKHRDVVLATTAEPSDVVITEIHALPRIAWTSLPTAFYVASDANVEALLGQLAESDVSSVNVQGFSGVVVDGMAGYRLTAETDQIRHLELGSPATPPG